MNRLRVTTVSGAVLLAATLGACGSGTTSTPAAPSPGAGTASTSAAAPGGASSATSAGGSVAAGGATVKAGRTSLGDIVVDAQGMTLYMYTKDTRGSGKSACTGQCLVAWPPLLVNGTATADGVTGALGTIDTPEGKKQVTLGGWPLYHFAKDKAPGDVTGQGVGGIWYVLGKDGTPRAPGGSGGGGY